MPHLVRGLRDGFPAHLDRFDTNANSTDQRKVSYPLRTSGTLLSDAEATIRLESFRRDPLSIPFLPKELEHFAFVTQQYMLKRVPVEWLKDALHACEEATRVSNPPNKEVEYVWRPRVGREDVVVNKMKYATLEYFSERVLGPLCSPRV